MSETSILSRFRERTQQSIEGQEPSWKNTLSRKFIGKEKISQKDLSDTKEYDSVDYTKSKQGEPLPMTEAEYRPWIRAKIVDAIQRNDFGGINPNALGGLRDDFIAWAYRGMETPSKEEIISFGEEILALSQQNQQESRNKSYFEREVADVISRMKQEIARTKEKALAKRENVGVQSREAKYGEGENQRVFEIPYGDFLVGVNLGDIAHAPTEAIMCPTTPVLEVGGGAIENVLYEAVGEQTFDTYARQLMAIVRRVRQGNEQERLLAAREFLDLLQTKTKLPLNITPEQAVGDILALTKEINWSTEDKEPEDAALIYGTAIAAPSGNLSERGIQTIVLTNVTPEGQGMTRNDMAAFTYNSCMAAYRSGADSITIPAVGTGFAAAFGFGLSQEDSIRGFLEGVRQFADEVQMDEQARLKRIDYNIYARPTQENALEVAKVMTKYGVFEILREEVQE